MLDLSKFNVYIVGGYVRDRILGREAKDHDFVVCGATPQDMTDAGFVPIEAQSFPVFHHPVSRDEYALARKEKKTGSGYHGFEAYTDPSITIEDDLIRRDLTCNAMARKVLGWNEEGHATLSDDLVDPYGGLDDLRNGILRHVSEAFAEDPLRVLRVARFAARYNFVVDPDTIGLMKQLVEAGELDHLTAERVWSELSRALTADQPTLFFWILRACGALGVLFPEIERSLMLSGFGLSRSALRNANSEIRMMLLFSAAPTDDIATLLNRFKAPSDVVRLSLKFNRLIKTLNDDKVLSKMTNASTGPQETLDVLKSFDAFRRPDDLFEMSAALGFSASFAKVDHEMDKLLRGFREARKVNFATLTDEQKENLKGDEIGNAIDETRCEKIREVMRLTCKYSHE